MSGRRRTRGFTLAELAVSLVVTAIVFALVMGIVFDQKRSLEGSELLRTMNETGKDAMLELDQRLRLAGFGVDPRYAFDFSWFDCTAADQLPGPNGRPTCRDRRDAPDRLVFMARSPNYRIDVNGTNGCTDLNGCPHGDAWRLVSTSLPQLTLTAHQGDVFQRGQVLLSVCPDGYRWTMSTVAQALSASAGGDVTLTLYPTNAAVPYFEDDYTPACYGTGATVFSVNRFAYSIQTFGGVPWLVLDEGLDLDGDGSDPWTTRDPGDLLPIAPDVEELQVAYVLNRLAGGVAPDTNADFVTGDDAAVGAPPEEPDQAAPAPQYGTGLSDATRQDLNPANIQAVRVSLVIRSDRRDPSHAAAWPGDALQQLENGDRVLTPAELGGYRRFSVSTTVAIRNLDSRGMFAF